MEGASGLGHKADMTNKEYRIESDSIGEKEVPAHAYYGVQTLRAFENFPITNTYYPSEMIVSVAEIKKAAALANFKAGCLEEECAQAIVSACDKIIAGEYHDAFITDAIQGGAGTSFNMNANEVIANIANEILGGEKGVYDKVHPNDHVNCGQSTNDVFPSCGKLTAVKLLDAAQNELKSLHEALLLKSEQFNDVIKMGRTQLQDAVPIRLGQEFKAYACAISRDIKRFDAAKDEMRNLNLGGTATGTGLNADVNYVKDIVPTLVDVCGIELHQTEDLIDGTQNLDCYPYVSGILKSCAVSLSKMSNDLRLMSCGPRCGLSEINLPAKQNGSSIMPGKVNPVIPEVVSQVAFDVIGNDVTIAMASEAGQLELNPFEPVIFYNLFNSINEIKHAAQTLTDNCVSGITANAEHTKEMVDNSVAVITALCPYVGYTEAARVAKLALKTGASVKDLILSEGLISQEDMDIILQPEALTKPGIAGLDKLGLARLMK